jgi:hypothetical protein
MGDFMIIEKTGRSVASLPPSRAHAARSASIAARIAVAGVLLAVTAGPAIAASPDAGKNAATVDAANDVPVLGPKPFMAYFRPIPVEKKALSSEAWGAADVGPRDTANGLEDVTMQQWNYWDGKILKGSDGKYRMFASRWDQARGHDAWYDSKAVGAVSDSPLGPYRDTGLLWPRDEEGKGHNVTALRLPDGRYAVVVSATRKGDVFVSSSADGPWRKLGRIRIDQREFKLQSKVMPADSELDRPLPSSWFISNISLIARPGGGFQIVYASGQVLISEKGVLGPYKVMGRSLYPGMAGMPQHNLNNLEDPMIWYSGGWYHLIVNHWEDRRAYHMISRDGITGWRLQGIAYEPGADFIRYADGTVNHWYKLERPGVLIEEGHVTAFTFAVVDVPKEEQTGNNGHGSKIVVIPFDGAAMDRDLAHVDK